jgi:hypothetical protein
MFRPAVLLLIITALVVATTAGCGDGDDAAGSTSCGPPVVELLNPDEGHLIAGVTPPTYLTDPPTSGPHTPGIGVAGGVVDAPLTPIEQVTTLENGIVIVQYRDPADAAALERLAGDHVVVAPHPDLPSAVIATAWARKLTCRAVDMTSLRAFIDSSASDHAGHVTTTNGA